MAPDPIEVPRTVPLFSRVKVAVVAEDGREVILSVLAAQQVA